MFSPYKKSTGTQYTATFALLLLALVASPLALFLSRPFGYASVVAALAFTILCSGLAWLQWTGHSDLTIPSIGKQSRGRK
jgi:hypothetical protein